ncbi:hypothetical protein NKH17_06775 [Mesorhizobium sp. M1334]|uniref:hypothetical protein n=1 Tax=Mesorhizobium sp. M1334 TaxID=2957084 RepID=UPI003337B5E5
MLNPGQFNLLNRAITTAIAGEAQTAVDKLAGILAATLQCEFAYGSGGTSCKVYAQVSLDQGLSWIDVACFAFTTASAVKAVNLSAGTPVATAITPTDGALPDNTVVDGILGAVMRAKISTTGTYANTTARLRLDAK